ncbi:MAG: hypothetical protein HY766_05575 [candidate division NC10 bacterium]|nr:hypothetical protein [candidate division NC10 bacterium]
MPNGYCDHFFLAPKRARHDVRRKRLVEIPSTGAFFSKLRDVIEGASTEKGIQEYLILLRVCQTCKYQGLDFLDFLRSGEKDIQAFAQLRRRKGGVEPSSGVGKTRRVARKMVPCVAAAGHAHLAKRQVWEGAQ